jgi:hypothetical protein
VRAVAQPSHKVKAAQQAGGGAGAAKPGDAGKAGAGAAAPDKKKRASQYTTWQAMAAHASNPSATPSGFDESMM